MHHVALKCLVPIAAMLLTAAAARRTAVPDCLKPARATVRVFDALGHNGKPNLGPLGMQVVHVIDRDFWADMQTRRGFDPDRVRKLVDALPPGNAPIILDIEHYRLDDNAETTMLETRELATIARAFKTAAPHRPLGFYGFFPLGGFGREIEADDDAGIARWKSLNDAMRILEREVDMIFPALYTNLDDAEGWSKQARATLCEARRLSRKPVYPFIWPEFHEGSPYKNQPVPGALWAVELDTLARYSDGIVIWDGWDFTKNRLKNWDDAAPWWRITQARMKQWRRSGRPAR